MNEQEHGIESCLVCTQESYMEVGSAESSISSHSLKIP